MILKKLSIINYKNISETTLELSPKINCFIGNNGMGKTNILDAVYYLSFCKSHSSAVDSQIVRHDSDFFVLEGDYVDEEGNEEQIYCGMKRGSRKHFKRNKKEYKRLASHIGLIPLILVSPSDTMLVEGGSEMRRKMIDIVISQYRPDYLEALVRYNTALQQRNALLKMEEEPDLSLMELWEEEMAREGERIYVARNDFLERLTPVFENFYRQVSECCETVSLNYVSHCQRGPLLEVIRRDRFKDRAVGYSLHGVHRDDIEMLIDGFPLRREGSQGQTKTFVVSLKLAQFDFLCQTTTHTQPLLLLDDIFDKLDSHRVEQIVKIVSDDRFGQIFIPDSNRDHLDEILRHSNHDYRIFAVKNGEISIQCSEEKKFL